MKFLCRELVSQKEFAPLKEALKERGVRLVQGVSEGALAPLLSALSEGEQVPLLYLCADEREAQRALCSLRVFFDDVRFFPARDLSLSTDTARSETFGLERLGILASLAAGQTPVIVATPDAVLQRTLPPEEFDSLFLKLTMHLSLSPEKLCEILVNLGYSHAVRVEGEGQFSRRGGIVDFFTPGEKDACRVEFFGDEVDRICFFDTQTQKSVAKAQSVTLLCARELYLTPTARALCLEAVEHALAGKLKEAERTFLEAQREALLRGRQAAEDTLFPLCYRHANLFDYLKDALVCVRNTPRVLESFSESAKAQSAILESLAETGAFALGAPSAPESREEVLSLLARHRTLSCSLLPTGETAGDVFSFSTRQAPLFGENREVLSSVLRDLVGANCRIYLLAQSDFAAENLAASLRREGFSAHFTKGEDREIEEGQILVFCSEKLLAVKGRVFGFESPVTRFCLLCETDSAPLTTSLLRRRTRSSSAKTKQAVTSYSELSLGDYVVHEAYGIGIFEGIETIRRDGAGRDFLKIRYAGSDVLYVPCSNLSQISKYVGRGSDGTVALAKMGKSTWNEHKRRAKAAAKDIARDLILLYSEREKTRGHAFSPDTPWQAQFEEAFEYEETPGQLAAVEDVKRDMESPRSMDRLLCGDVGFGKTEVALRAVFKCVMDSRQAAVLAPTTLLCQQHLRTIKARFRGYPVRIDILSRFSTKKEVQGTLAALKDGSCDIVVGTHRLLQKDVEFCRLGLLVVDEEQRFGVTHKETLKRLSKSVDVLTLTATPIPRTLNMALSGVRDLSLLEEAPGDRLPVQTVVTPFDEGLILAAVRKELSRRGQVFYLVNDIERLPSRAAWLRQNLPEARVKYAHGKLDRDSLSELWQEMSEGEIDILVCTTIVETGIDLPSANTLVVEHAERFGLSQLHQLRGRVGRSWRRAYAYFTFPAQRALPELAEKRLSAIREFARFGSGFQLAMRDLELRGAGNLLGAEQSGHMEKVGYDLYMRILQDAVLEEQGITPEKTADCYIDLPIRARLSEDYVPDSADRIALYQRFSNLLKEEQEKPLREELRDRFGSLPAEAENLFLVASLRREALALGFEKVSLTENVLSFWAEAFDERILALLSAVFGRYFYVSGGEKKRLNLRLVNKDPIEEVQNFFFHYRAFLQDVQKEDRP